MDLDLDLPFSNGRASFRVHFKLGDREALVQETQGSRSALCALVTKARRDLLGSHGVTTLVCREVKLEPGPKLTLLMPFRDRETSMFWWPELCVRESTVAAAGLGVFAARPLRAGWCIPMVGRKTTAAEAQELMDTDRAQYLFDAAGQYIDGREAGREAASRGRGLGMAMLVNEPPATSQGQLRIWELHAAGQATCGSRRGAVCVLWRALWSKLRGGPAGVALEGNGRHSQASEGAVGPSLASLVTFFAAFWTSVSFFVFWSPRQWLLVAASATAS